jgi:hypothetical protein
MVHMSAALRTLGLIGVGALSLYYRFWLHHREEWNWEEHEYPARPTGRPSPRTGDDEVD